MHRPQVLKQGAVVVALAHWEAEQAQVHHQPPQQSHQCQELCIPGTRNIGCIAPFGSLATL